MVFRTWSNFNLPIPLFGGFRGPYWGGRAGHAGLPDLQAGVRFRFRAAIEAKVWVSTTTQLAAPAPTSRPLLSLPQGKPGE